ncbi:MAG: rRNA maturation RNase YbeY [Fidelibacterota bacterium]
MIEVTWESLPGLDTVAAVTARRLVETALTEAAVTAAQITLIYTDDEYLRHLKQEFFHQDQYTDVIAFRLNDYTEAAVEGEIYISLPRAWENSRIFSEPYSREVARLIVHGTLHLLGWNDETEAEKAAMRTREEAVLDAVNWKPLVARST